jgi:hypothetical protein
MKAGKVIYNCLLADLCPPGKRPARADFAHGWPEEIQQRVLDWCMADLTHCAGR